MFRQCMVFVMVIIAFLSGCDRHQIIVDGSVVSEQNGIREREGMIVVTYENPILTGLIRSNGIRINDEGTGTCCNRVLMHASTDAFIRPDLARGRSAFLSITEESAETTYGPVWDFKVPAIAVPDDGSEISVTLADGGRTRLSATLSLDEQVIVLPVHVHLFLRVGEDTPRDVKSGDTMAWFERPDDPGFGTVAVTVTNALSGLSETYIDTEYLRGYLYVNADTIWHQANIQFSIKSYEVVRNDELADQIVGGTFRSLSTSTEHAEYRDIPGIHIYLGRNSRNLASPGGFAIIQGQTDGPGCGDRISRNHAIVMAYDTLRGTKSNALGHELGHYLGLEHTNESFYPSCGRGLAPGTESSNLMTTGSSTDTLTDAQVDRTREIACRYLNSWSISSRACP